ncbi:C40 family peptidase [Desulfolutivibrio sulfoxidireducens]|uniref:C40 family peptidase n=1 Tax=Desulfolutivibrio sulfoxidireducens TaxID=2773299 RepID=UPI00159E2E48|nr:C40 family peptidase [Desulfolutivibrio sulfoxidireducens]QLA16381.1 NlpC/P60 family protein [Desulfolutivibrio sulfoxidireducens]
MACFRKVRAALAGAAFVAVLAWVAAVPAAAQTVYGYEDGLGMLHTSSRKLDARYKELYTVRPGEKKPDHQVLVAALREKRAIEETIPVVSIKDLLVGLDGRGSAILRAAEPFLGAPYRFGGDTPAGVDCSGLTRAVYLRLGTSLPRHSADQAGTGVAVSRDMLLPGDLLFFSTNLETGINHVGIFLGGGRMLHSSSRAAGVRVERMDGGDYARWFVAARRVASPSAIPPNPAGSDGPNRAISQATQTGPRRADL